MKPYKNPKSVIILIGPPGSGKGTQAELLAEKLNLCYLETAEIGEGRMKRAKKGEYIEVEGKKFYLAEQKRLWERGKLWDPPFITYLMKEKIETLFKEGKGVVLAGSPRTLYEGEKLIPVLKKLYGVKNIKVILIKLSAKESIFRNSRRRICELMRHPILYTKETARLKRCPLDGSRLIKRKKLDDLETIKVRLKEYKERTLPLIKYFKKQGLRIKKVDGEQSVEGVFKNILKALK